MKLFVTGGTGFIGSHFLRQAIAAGHEVRAQRRMESQTRLSLEIEPEWLIVPLDRLEPQHFVGTEVVVHLAAHSANVPYDSLENCLHWNVTVPLRMGLMALSAGVKRFFVAGSCFEYGRAADRYDRIPTHAPLEPTQSYPISKAAASVAWQGLARERSADVTIMRIFQVYGEGEHEGRLWPALKKAAKTGADYPMTAGGQVRDFIEVGEVARKILRQVEEGEPSWGDPRVVHIGTARPRTVRDFAEQVWSENGATGKLLFGVLPYRSNEVMRYVPKI
jgi:nucleoside-diphosphate-sugar epimerase